jgi:tRNA(adenine34) deaminase
MKQTKSDEYYMKIALQQANKAFRIGEVPVGALVVLDDKIIGRGYNRVETKQDALQHAELIAIRQTARKLQSWRLERCQLFVTLEPCAMCAGAITWSRIARVVYGATDPKAGACGSALRVLGHKRLNHRPKIKAGVEAEASSDLLKEFFRELRKKKKSNNTERCPSWSKEHDWKSCRR